MEVEITAALCIGEFYGKQEVVMAANEQLENIADQCGEIVARVANGSLDPSAVEQALGDILEGRLSEVRNWNPPTWWRTPEQQLARARQLWPHDALPKPPKEFVPRTRSEVLLLHVPMPFDALWWQIDPPPGFTKHYMDDTMVPTGKRLRGVSRIYLGSAWLGFDPEYGRGEAPRDVTFKYDLAASEVLSALIQFPEWCLSWTEGGASPCLSGTQVPNIHGWPEVLYLDLWESDKKLYLVGGNAAEGHEDWASPSVRVLADSV
jgi:hypothetical protein